MQVIEEYGDSGGVGAVNGLFCERLRSQCVLVQREMECGRSPLASIARASAHRVPLPNATLPGRGSYSKRKANWLGARKEIECAAYCNGSDIPPEGGLRGWAGSTSESRHPGAIQVGIHWAT